jgi:hypothetical protein
MSAAPQLELQPVADAIHLRPAVGDWANLLLIKMWSALKWVTRRVKVQQARKSLRICENVSLGEKRFVAVVQVDDEARHRQHRHDGDRQAPSPSLRLLSRGTWRRHHRPATLPLLVHWSLLAVMIAKLEGTVHPPKGHEVFPARSA